jgi:hypothetical protein
MDTTLQMTTGIAMAFSMHYSTAAQHIHVRSVVWVLVACGCALMVTGFNLAPCFDLELSFVTHSMRSVVRLAAEEGIHREKP